VPRAGHGHAHVDGCDSARRPSNLTVSKVGAASRAFASQVIDYDITYANVSDVRNLAPSDATGGDR